MQLFTLLQYRIQEKYRNKLLNLSIQIPILKCHLEFDLYNIILSAGMHLLEVDYQHFPCLNLDFSLNLHFFLAYIIYLSFHHFRFYFYLLCFSHQLDFIYVLQLLVLVQFQMQITLFEDFEDVYVTKYVLEAKFQPKTQLVFHLQVDSTTNMDEDDYIKETDQGFNDSFEFSIYKIDQDFCQRPKYTKIILS